MPVHNESQYLSQSLHALKRVENQIDELIVILDRCTDDSGELVKKYFPDAKIIEKSKSMWKNNYAENLQLGYEASKGDVICIHDADMRIPPNLFTDLLQELKGNVMSVSPGIETDKKASFFNLIYHYWEKTRVIAPLGEQPRGGVRLVLRDGLEKIGGFKDVIAPDTQIDIDLRKNGYESKICKNVICLHLRRFSFKKAIGGQINSGRMRRGINMPFWKVLGHSVIRLRPFVIYGYFSKRGSNSSKGDKT